MFVCMLVFIWLTHWLFIVCPSSLDYKLCERRDPTCFVSYLIHNTWETIWHVNIFNKIFVAGMKEIRQVNYSAVEDKEQFGLQNNLLWWAYQNAALKIWCISKLILMAMWLFDHKCLLNFQPQIFYSKYGLICKFNTKILQGKNVLIYKWSLPPEQRFKKVSKYWQYNVSSTTCLPHI